MAIVPVTSSFGSRAGGVHIYNEVALTFSRKDVDYLVGFQRDHKILVAYAGLFVAVAHFKDEVDQTLQVNKEYELAEAFCDHYGHQLKKVIDCRVYHDGDFLLTVLISV